MHRFLSRVALLVREYDEAIAYFTRSLDFALVEDTALGGGKRWVVVAPPGAREAGLLLARAVTDEQRSAFGRQGGGRVFLFLETEDFDRDFGAFTSRGVKFLEGPRDERYGRVAVFADLYGNKWDLIGRGRERVVGGAA